MSVKTIDDLPWALVQLLTHWKDLNAKLAPAEIVLTGDYGRTEMLQELEEFNRLNERIADCQKDHKAVGDILLRERTELKEFMRQFTMSVKGLLMGTPYVAMLPKMPDLYAHERPFMQPMEAAARLWAKINTDPPPPGFARPLVLAGGLTQSGFEAKIRKTAEAFRQREAAISAERAIRKEREALATRLRNRAIQYHRVVSGSFPPDSEEVKPLPRLWPPTKRRKKSEDETPSE